MDLIITLLVLLGIASIVWYVLKSLSLPEPIRILAVVVIAIVAIVLLLRLMPGGALLG